MEPAALPYFGDMDGNGNGDEADDLTVDEQTQRAMQRDMALVRSMHIMRS